MRMISNCTVAGQFETVLSDFRFSNKKKQLRHFSDIRIHVNTKNHKRYFKSGSLPNNCAKRDISFRKTFSKLYFIELNFICYNNALNYIRYLSDTDFKDQIRNCQEMDILGHPVGSYLDCMN